MGAPRRQNTDVGPKVRTPRRTSTTATSTAATTTLPPRPTGRRRTAAAAATPATSLASVPQEGDNSDASAGLLLGGTCDFTARAWDAPRATGK